MSQRYQLPCPSCSAVLKVSTTQAGESLTCSCGKEVLVPTLRELRQLDTAADEISAAKTSSWSPLRGGLFVSGICLIAVAAIGHWRIDGQRRELDIAQPEFRKISFDVQTLTLSGAWQAWTHFRDQSLDFRETPQFVENRRKHRELTAYLYGFWTAAGVGALLVIVSLCLGGKPLAARGTGSSPPR